MKLTKTANTKIKPGMTLIEITVVILVLLTLIAVLFIGANIYKKGADRAACILNIRNVHQAVRANQNLKGKNAGDTLDMANDIYSTIAVTESGTVGDPGYVAPVVGVERYLTEPNCPTDSGAYAAETTYPAVSTVAVTCTNNGITDGAGNGIADHVPGDTGGW